MNPGRSSRSPDTVLWRCPWVEASTPSSELPSQSYAPGRLLLGLMAVGVHVLSPPEVWTGQNL